jgi:hypothetical protein
MSGEEVSRESKDNDILRLAYLCACDRRIMWCNLEGNVVGTRVLVKPAAN